MVRVVQAAHGDGPAREFLGHNHRQHEGNEQLRGRQRERDGEDHHDDPEGEGVGPELLAARTAGEDKQPAQGQAGGLHECHGWQSPLGVGESPGSWASVWRPDGPQTAGPPLD